MDGKRKVWVFLTGKNKRGGEETNSVRLSSGLNALLKGVEQDFKAIGKMQRMGSTDLSYLSMVVSRDVRVSYRFELADGSPFPNRPTRCPHWKT